jgi:hypothetical protein
VALDLGPFVIFLRVIPAVLLLWLFVVVMRAPLQEQANRLFGLFLLVLATGFLLEFYWMVVSYRPGIDGVPAVWVSLASGGRTVQSFLGVVDPPLLLAATLAYLGRWSILRKPGLWVAYGLTGLAFWWERSVFAFFGGDWVNLTHILYVNGTYLVSFLFLLRGCVSDHRRFVSRQLSFLAVAVGFAAFSRTGAFFLWDAPEALRMGTGLWTPPVSMLVALGLVMVVYLGVSWRGGAKWRSRGGMFGVIGALLVAFHGFWWMIWLLGAGAGWGMGLFTAFFSLRWIVVAGVMGYGSMRYQLFDFDFRVREAAAVMSATLVAVGVGMVAGALLHQGGQGGLGVFQARMTGIAVGVVVFYPAWVWTSALVRWFWPASDSVVRWKKRRLEIYEATLEYALGKPDWSAAERRFVETLRHVFEVTPEEHDRVIMRLQQQSPAAAST